jgi:NAD-dependent SIR2 family protein deacetylase
VADGKPKGARGTAVSEKIVPPQASTVVLTGAGFSWDAGLPLTHQLISKGCERLRPGFKDEFLKLLNALSRNVLRGPVGKNIEAVLTRLRVLHLYSKKHDYMEEIFPLEMGTSFLIWAALRLSANPPPRDLYDAFLRRLGDDVAFASLNYDLVLETAFRRNQLTWHYPLQGEKKVRNDLNYREHFYDPSKQDLPSIPYLKLHGSFNWQYCWRCNYINIVREEWAGVSQFYLPRPQRGDYLWVGRRMLVCDECTGRSDPQARQAALKPLIIPPTRVKEYSRAPIRRLWAFFDLLLAQGMQIILVGTSIRDEDILLFNSLNLLRFKNPGLRKLIVINPDGRMKRKVHRLTEVETTWYPDLGTYIASE